MPSEVALKTYTIKDNLPAIQLEDGGFIQKPDQVAQDNVNILIHMNIPNYHTNPGGGANSVTQSPLSDNGDFFG